MFGARTVNVGDFVERQLVVVFRRLGLRNLAAVFRQAVENVQLAQVLVTGLDMYVSEQPEASGRILHAGLDQSPPPPVAERLMEIADFVKLLVDIALFDQVAEPLQLRLVEAPSRQRLEDRFGGEHSRLHRHVDAFEPLRIEEAGRIADDQKSVAVIFRLREKAAFGDGFRAVMQHLAAFEHLRNRRMQFELIEEPVWIGERVVVIQPDDEADVEQVVPHPVDEPSAEGVVGQRVTERVHHEARLDAPFRQFPYFLHSDSVNLRVAVFVESELLDKLLGQRAARPFAQHGHLGEDVGPRLVILLRLAVLADALVARAHAYDPVVLVVEQLGAGEFGNEHDVRRLDDGPQPAYKLVQTYDVFTVVPERRRDDRRPDLEATGQIRNVLFADLGFERRAEFLVIGQQLRERADVHHRARNDVRADLAPLLDHCDRDFAEGIAALFIVFVDELAQTQRSGQ